MQYIKTFEELKFEPNYDIEWTKEQTDWGYEYSFEIEGKVVKVTFDKVLENMFPNMYEREFKSGYNFDMLNIGADKVLSVVTAITFEFLKEYNPDCLIIHHINADKEKTSSDKLNKRARASYRYLQNIKGWNLKYFGQKFINSNGSIVTICFIYNKIFFRIPFYFPLNTLIEIQKDQDI